MRILLVRVRPHLSRITVSSRRPPLSLAGDTRHECDLRRSETVRTLKLGSAVWFCIGDGAHAASSGAALDSARFWFEADGAGWRVSAGGEQLDVLLVPAEMRHLLRWCSSVLAH
jgi:hypothetical protein